jgi:hypothetical protein
MIDKESKRRGENYLARLIKNGTVGLNSDGSLRVAPQRVKQSPQVRPAPTHTLTPPSDYPRLVQAARAWQWTMSKDWFRLEHEIHSYVEKNNAAQTARCTAALCAYELSIPEPAVIAWLGHEPKTQGKLGWMYSDNLQQINVLVSQPCRQVVFTTGHECRHIYQFVGFPNLTPSERESDADSYARDFDLRIFATRDIAARRAKGGAGTNERKVNSVTQRR